ncbi:MAG: FAD-dependent oxidoreductase, partial [Kofleriaceae bacterium]|nr:FAD-dependent oxidoreductase [Kofleriaceae bacterium]
HLQKQIEEAAWQAGGGKLVAPAMRVSDFVHERASSSLPKSSYVPGLKAADLSEIVDAGGVRISTRLRTALLTFNEKMRGYIGEEATIVGVESRTSAPLRVPRDRETLESTSLARLYPCGEGAGYAGGIVSAAMDGIRVARAIAAVLAPALQPARQRD